MDGRMTGFRTLDQAAVKGKRVLLRVDLNVPVQNGVVSDATRIQRMAPTIIEIADWGGVVILLSHLGRPKGPDPKDSLKPIAAETARIIGRRVAFVDDCIGAKAEAAGPAMEAELAAFSRVLDAPQRPLAAIVGGAKVSTKLELLGNLLPRVNVLI